MERKHSVTAARAFGIGLLLASFTHGEYYAPHTLAYPVPPTS
jgi:hypothetical protein